MPLRAAIRDAVNEYLFKHIVPKGVRPRPRTAMGWFEDRFAFIGDSALQRHLAEAFYQARYFGRIREALALSGGFNNAFIKSQIILYASIYEAVIDHYLEANKAVPEVEKVLLFTEYVPQSALSKSARMVVEIDGQEVEVYPCRRKSSIRDLKLVRFNDRVDAGVAIGLVPKAQADFIKALYKSRNAVHIVAATRKGLAPDGAEASQAFRNVFDFIRHVEKWAKP